MVRRRCTAGGRHHSFILSLLSLLPKDLQADYSGRLLKTRLPHSPPLEGLGVVLLRLRRVYHPVGLRLPPLHGNLE